MQTKYTLQMRLIPINKVFPNIPRGNQLRPICIQSHVIKLVEMFYIDNLQRKMKYDIGEDQVGFVPGLGTQMNLWQVTEYARNKGKNKSMVFIDLSNAYNTVDRDKLYEIIVKNQWMDVDAARFIMTLYDEMYFWDPIDERRIYLKQGLHQGFLVAPMLFNLYFNDLLKEWRTRILWKSMRLKNSKKKRISKIMRKTRALTYADDIVIMADRQVAGFLFKQLEEVTKEYSMKMNMSKCAYMANKEIEKLEILQCKKVKTYKYLGIWIGSLIHNYKQQVGHIVKTAWRLRGINKLMPMRHLVKLWSVFIKPYFDYVATILWMQKKSMIQKYETLWRKVIKIVCGLRKGFSIEGYKAQYIRRIQESRQEVKEWGFKDLELMEKYIYKDVSREEYKQILHYGAMLFIGTFEESGLNRHPYYQEVQALVNRKNALEKQIDEKMAQYERKHADFLKKTGKQQHQKIDSNRIRKVTNYGYFDQWRYSNVKCKEHHQAWFNREHILKHLVTGWPNGLKWVKELEEMNQWVLAPTNFGKKCVEKKNNIMKYISNKIRQIIEKYGVFFKKMQREIG